MESLGVETVRELWGGQFVDWTFLPAQGVAGGVLCWDGRVLVKEEEEEVGAFSVSCLFRCIEDDFRWAFTGVYGPVHGGERIGFWEELHYIAFRWGVPWCVGGDFNVVRSLEVKRRARLVTASMRMFSSFNDEVELVDLLMQGGVFTWSGG